MALSVPNDAFWSIQNPFHHTMWGEGAFEELRRLLPEDTSWRTRSRCRARWRWSTARRRALDRRGGGGDRRADPLPRRHRPGRRGAGRRRGGREADLVEQRRWERQRESDLAFLSSSRGAREWRKYIHGLEGRLGLPLSGTGDDD